MAVTSPCSHDTRDGTVPAVTLNFSSRVSDTPKKVCFIVTFFHRILTFFFCLFLGIPTLFFAVATFLLTIPTFFHIIQIFFFSQLGSVTSSAVC